MELGFCPDYLREAAASFAGDKITMAFGGEKQPVLITGDGNLMAIVMPMRI
jgi:DNA polymerase III sliding clamp (beta) subunit (PCNA family)